MRGVVLSKILFFVAIFLSASFPQVIHSASSDKSKHSFYQEPASFQNNLDHQESIRTYTDAIRQKPYDPIAYYNRAMVYSALRSYDLALADFDKAISLRPTALQPYISKLGTLYAAGKYDELYDVSNQVITNFKNHPWGYYWRGRALIAKGKPEQAIEDLKKFLEKEDNPERISDVCYYIASAYFERGEFNAALTHLNRAIIKNPLNPENWILRGLVYKSKLEYGLALSDLKRGLQISRNTSALACNSVAWILATCPDPAFRNGSEAVKIGRKAVETD